MHLKAIQALVHRELQRLLYSNVIAFIILLFLVMMGGMFFLDFFDAIQVLDLRKFFSQAPLLLSFFCPALSMNMLAAERQQKSLEWLQSLPLSNLDIVLAKWLACSIILALTLSFSLAYPLTLASLGPLDWGPVWAGFLGLQLLGMAFLAIGMLCSAFSKDAMIAVLSAFFLCTLLSQMQQFSVGNSGWLASLLQELSASYHFGRLARGVLDVRDLLYLLSLMIFALSFSVLKLESQHYPSHRRQSSALPPSRAFLGRRECLQTVLRERLEDTGAKADSLGTEKQKEDLR